MTARPPLPMELVMVTLAEGMDRQLHADQPSIEERGSICGKCTRDAEAILRWLDDRGYVLVPKRTDA